MNFNSLKLSSWILDALNAMNFVNLTKIQEQSLPLLLNKQSLIITSKTGSGKTLCYLLPILNNIDFNLNQVQSIVVLPTKELARQVYSKLIDFKKSNDKLKIKLLIGHEDDLQSWKNNSPQVVVGTPVKVLDYLKNKTINRNIKTLVLDECDMLLDLGFTNVTNQILSFTNTYSLQKIACSATTHISLANQFKNYLSNTKVVSTSQSIWSNSSIEQSIVYSNNNHDSLNTLLGLLKNINPYFSIIFCNTKNIANDVYEKLLNRNFNVALLHKNLTSRQRKNIYKEITKNTYQYLVATDIASRGLDIEGVDIVISYGLPDESIWYMHRIGRTGRYNKVGKSYIIYQNNIDHNIVKLTNKGIKFNYLFLNNESKLIDKPLKLRFKQYNRVDEATNLEIKKIIGTNSKKVRPGYKKQIKAKIYKLKQKKKHEYIEKKIKQNLIMKNIRDSKFKKGR